MKEASQQEREMILNSFEDLRREFDSADTAHDGHMIWLLAGEAVRRLCLRYNCPMAFNLAENLIDYHIGRFNDARAAAS
jgi:hypothetical protein